VFRSNATIHANPDQRDVPRLSSRHSRYTPALHDTSVRADSARLTSPCRTEATCRSRSIPPLCDAPDQATPRDEPDPGLRDLPPRDVPTRHTKPDLHDVPSLVEPKRLTMPTPPALHSSKSQEHLTPEDIIEAARQTLGGFDLESRRQSEPATIRTKTKPLRHARPRQNIIEPRRRDRPSHRPVMPLRRTRAI
jgi:hypothetical protein